LIDWVLALPEELEQQLRTKIHQFEENRQMPYISSWERLAIREGLAKGLEQGLEQGKQLDELTVILQLLQNRFGVLDATMQRQFKRLPAAQLETLTDKLLTFANLLELKRWLKQQRQASASNRKQIH
jgi:hypothetical protein